MHCLGALLAARSAILQCTLEWLRAVGSGHWNSCNALPRSLWAVGSGTPAMRCHNSLGQWVVKVLQCTAALPRGSGQWNSCNARTHCLWTVGSGLCNSYNALPQCMGAPGNGTATMQCLAACGQWVVELLQCTTSLPAERVVAVLQCTASVRWGSGRWKSRNALPDYLWSVGKGILAMHCHAARGLWAVQLLQCTFSLRGGIGQWNASNALPHCLGVVGSVTPTMHRPTARGRWVVPHCLRAPGSGNPAMHYRTPYEEWAVRSGIGALNCHTAWWQWATEFLQCSASLPRGTGQCNYCNALPHCLWAVGSGQWNSYNALLHCLGAVGSGTPAMQCLTAWRCSAKSCNPLPHCLWAMGSGTRARHRHTASGQWAVELLQCTASLPGGHGHCNSCNALPHCLGAVDSANPAMHCLTSWGPWVVQLLQCTASLHWAVEILMHCLTC